MTVSSVVNKTMLNGNGSTSAFPFSFKFTAASQIQVFVDDTLKTLSTHYTLSAPGDSGTVTFLTSPDFRPQTGQKVTIVRIDTIDQADFDPTAGGGLSSAALESAFDDTIMKLQQIAEQVGRAPKLKQTTPTGALTFPEPEPGSAIGWNSAGDDLMNVSGSIPSTVNVTAFGEALVESVSAAAARATLGLAATTTDNAIIRADGTTGGTQNSGVIIDDSNNVALPGTLSIAPASGSTQQGINIAQTGPTSGTDPQSIIYFNRILVDSAGTKATSNGDIHALGVSLGVGGSNAAGQHIAILGQTVLNSSTGSGAPDLKVYCGITGISQGSVNDGGSGTSDSTVAKGYILGMNAFSILASGATNYLHSTPIEMLTTVRTGASVRNHVGARVVQFFDHAVSGANMDAGFQFINQVGAVGWKDYGIVFDGTSDSPGTMFKSTATVLGLTGTHSLTNGIVFPNTVTFSGNAFQSGGFSVNGVGDIANGSPGSVRGRHFFAGPTSGQVILQASNIASGTLTLPSATDTLVGLNTTDTLTNKTLTSPTLTTPNIGVAVGTSATLSGAIVSTSTSAGVGYKSPAGGTVTQATSKATAVTLNNVAGLITMNNAALTAGANVSFVVNCSSYSIATGDVVVAIHVAGGTTGAYDVKARNNGANSFQLNITNNTGGSLSETPIIGYTVIKGGAT